MAKRKQLTLRARESAPQSITIALPQRKLNTWEQVGAGLLVGSIACLAIGAVVHAVRS